MSSFDLILILQNGTLLFEARDDPILELFKILGMKNRTLTRMKIIFFPNLLEEKKMHSSWLWWVVVSGFYYWCCSIIFQLMEGNVYNYREKEKTWIDLGMNISKQEPNKSYK